MPVIEFEIKYCERIQQMRQIE